MSLIDKVVAAVTPPESDDARRKARIEARRAATPGDWLHEALDHHLQIEAAITSTREATSPAERAAAFKAFATVLTGHANAEESVLYPALAAADEKGHATMGYTEQAAVKIQMGMLENLPLMSQAFIDKLEHIRGALLHHMYEEEGTWFLELKSKNVDQARLTARFIEEFERYAGDAEDLLDEDDGDAPLGNLGKGASDRAPLR
jgi:hemerythrin superfamily protein